MESEVEVYLGLGSNLGDKKGNILNAIRLIEEKGIVIISTSTFVESDSWGYSSENSFINCCLKVKTSLNPLELLSCLQQIEQVLGRKFKTSSLGYSDRIIDVDILFFGDNEISHDLLQVPHPLLAMRKFVLEPLVQIAPEFIHPTSKITLSQLLKNIR